MCRYINIYMRYTQENRNLKMYIKIILQKLTKRVSMLNGDRKFVRGANDHFCTTFSISEDNWTLDAIWRATLCVCALMFVWVVSFKIPVRQN